MANYAWMTGASGSLNFYAEITSDLFDSIALGKEFFRKYKHGIPLGPDEVPKIIHVHPGGRNNKLRRCRTVINGPGALVTEAIADILRQFRLGQTALYPVTVFERDRTTPAPCPPYALLAVGESRERLLPELCTRIDKLEDNPWPWSTAFTGRDDLVLRKSPPSDVDMWRDPQDSYGIYYTDELQRALTAAGFGRAFKPQRCRLVDPVLN